MRERISFIRPLGSGLDPGSLVDDSKGNGLVGPSVEAIRQDRLTVGLAELPPRLAALLADYARLQASWSSPRPHDCLDPLAARLSPGLHLRLTPVRRPGPHHPDQVCSFLQHVLGPLDCTVPEAFTTAPDGELVFYQRLDSLAPLVDYARRELCPEADALCQARLDRLPTAAGIDLSLDAAAGSLQLTAFWPLGRQAIAAARSPARRTELGILALDQPPHREPDEVALSGLLIRLDDDREGPSPTAFSFPSRHRRSDASFSADFLAPAGVHPILQLQLSSAEPPAEQDQLDNCLLHAYFTLPKAIFADRYQLQDSLLLASNNLSALRHSSLPVDLEAPAYATPSWGSSLLLQLAPPASSAPAHGWTAQVPLHLRYLEPAPTGHRRLELPYPLLFWACPAANPSLDFAASPFDRRPLGYDHLFDPATVFWHLTPRPAGEAGLVSAIDVPVLGHGPAAASLIAIGTLATVGLAFAWLLWKLVSLYVATGLGPAPLEPLRRRPSSPPPKPVASSLSRPPSM